MQLSSQENAHSLDLPQPIAAYLDADNAKDGDKLTVWFAHDATVHDEGHNYHGIAAIKSWKQEAQRKYQYVVEPLHVTVLETSLDKETVRLHARVTGTFPGSSVELDYTFTLAGGKITSLEVG